uniref:Uncharacterized protein n=1 Tax=Arundo donax TaxID=35708 RepID=A0A0A9QPV8_ARUDO
MSKSCGAHFTRPSWLTISPISTRHLPHAALSSSRALSSVHTGATMADLEPGPMDPADSGPKFSLSSPWFGSHRFPLLIWSLEPGACCIGTVAGEHEYGCGKSARRRARLSYGCGKSARRRARLSTAAASWHGGR